jgi:CDP-paratose 2-epimerase
MKDQYLITGGAGFIGINVADYYLARGKRITILDNFSRVGSRLNATQLSRKYPEKLTIVEGNLLDRRLNLLDLVNQAEIVFHFAAQVAVTTSVTDPVSDFETNAAGTFYLLDVVRHSSSRPIFIYSSTNKVYGKMEDLPIRTSGRRYDYVNLPQGVSETRPLDFYSPYGCSKGAGDQYTLDFARIYGIKTVCFRQSCIYGPHQFGIEDQGWLAWFAIRALCHKPVTIYGNGMQVRDVLYISDLIEAYEKAICLIDQTAGKAYNIGGGPKNTLSLLELIEMLQTLLGYPVIYSFADWRPGDQAIYVSDICKAKNDFGWEPMIGIKQGVSELVCWLQQDKNIAAIFSR